MKKLIFLTIILLTITLVNAVEIEHNAVANLGQAIDYKVTIQPSEIETMTIVNPEGTELLDWSINHKDITYEYEVRGNSFINTWVFTQPNKRTLEMVAKIQFNKVGSHDLIFYYENGETQLEQSTVVVLNEQLCGNNICDVNEELTCPQECKKFELPKIPKWLIGLGVIIFIAILIIAFIRIKYWY